MMARNEKFSDDDLGLYLDGEADAELVASVETALATDADLSERLNALRATTANFTEIYKTVLDLAPNAPSYLSHAEKPGRPVLLALASMVAGAAVMFGGLTLWQPAEQPGWRAVVANYQSLYVAETLTGAMPDPAQQEVLLAQLAKKLGFGLDDLPEIDGLTFVRAQELGFNGKPLAQLTFLTAQNQPVALCIIKTGKETTNTIEPEELFGLSTYSWTQDGYGILLIGPNENRGLQDAAEQFRRTFAHTNA